VGRALTPLDPIRAPDVSAADSARVERKDWSDLGARILSSAILAPAGLAAAWAGGPWLAGACGAAVVAMAYEWARMSEPKDLTPAFLFALIGALGAVMFASWRMLDWGLVWLAGCGAVSAVRRRSLSGVIETAGGLIYIGAPPAIFLWLRDRGDEGLATILALFIIIWSADVFAYFGGKVIGGPKIAEGLSPNKTWSGIVTGAMAGTAAGYGCALLFDASADVRLGWLVVGLVLAFTGLMGDLFESFLKRRFGVKDASRLIPGHGGVLDRIDGLMAATLLFGAVLALWPRLSAVLIGEFP
jgi:phosphatidate cytidylyltransferase